MAYAAFPVADRNGMNPEHLGDVRLSKVQFQAVDFELIAQGVGRPGGSLVGSPVRGIWIPAHGDVDIPECQEASNVLETWFLHEGRSALPVWDRWR